MKRILVMLLLAACGREPYSDTDPPHEGRPVTVTEAARIVAVAACAHLALDPLPAEITVADVPNEPCTLNGSGPACCIDGGIGGRSWPGNVIELPIDEPCGCVRGVGHEWIHQAKLRQFGDWDRDHFGPEWCCQMAGVMADYQCPGWWFGVGPACR